MNIWLGGGTRHWTLNSMLEGSHAWYLGSFFHLTPSLQNMISPDQFSFFLDSGAYSAWSRGTEIDLDEYVAFIKANIENIEVYASLDVIPGKPGSAATTKQRDDAAEQSWKNYLYMVREGLDPLPVYHYGENLTFLERMLDHGCQYIGIGGLVSVPSLMRRHWLDKVFARLTGSDGKPIVKTHGFGMTAIPLIFRYPWYSIDSTTWIKITSTGSVYLPQLVDGEFVFDQVPRVVSVSSVSPRAVVGGKHANTMSTGMKEVLNRWLKFCGKNYDEVFSSYYHRAVVNVTFFKMVAEAKATQVFKPCKQARRGSIW